MEYIDKVRNLLDRIVKVLRFHEIEADLIRRFKDMFYGLMPDVITVQGDQHEASLRIEIQPLLRDKEFNELICAIESFIARKTKRTIAIEEIELKLTNITGADLELGGLRCDEQTASYLHGESGEDYYAIVIFYYG